MIPIQIDISPIIMEYKLIGEQSDALAASILDVLVDSFMFEWENQINGNLHSTREEYRKAIDVERPDMRNAVISLKPTLSQLALMLEEGASAWDMKEGFSRSGKKTIKADGGWYLTIPFRWATTEALAESAIFSNQMPKPIEQAVMKMPVNIGTGNSKGLGFLDIPEQYRAVLGKNPTTGYQHQSPIYQGLRRQQASSTSKENRGNYFSFRRVSDKSDEGSWWHKGFVPLKLMDKTVQNIDLNSIVSKQIDNFLGL